MTDMTSTPIPTPELNQPSIENQEQVQAPQAQETQPDTFGAQYMKQIDKRFTTLDPAKREDIKNYLLGIDALAQNLNPEQTKILHHGMQLYLDEEPTRSSADYMAKVIDRLMNDMMNEKSGLYTDANYFRGVIGHVKQQIENHQKIKEDQTNLQAKDNVEQTTNTDITINQNTETENRQLSLRNIYNNFDRTDVNTTALSQVEKSINEQLNDQYSVVKSVYNDMLTLSFSDAEIRKYFSYMILLKQKQRETTTQNGDALTDTQRQTLAEFSSYLETSGYPEHLFYSQFELKSIDLSNTSSDLMSMGGGVETPLHKRLGLDARIDTSAMKMPASVLDIPRDQQVKLLKFPNRKDEDFFLSPSTLPNILSMIKEMDTQQEVMTHPLLQHGEFPDHHKYRYHAVLLLFKLIDKNPSLTSFPPELIDTLFVHFPQQAQEFKQLSPGQLRLKLQPTITNILNATYQNPELHSAIADANKHAYLDYVGSFLSDVPQLSNFTYDPSQVIIKGDKMMIPVLPNGSQSPSYIIIENGVVSMTDMFYREASNPYKVKTKIVPIGTIQSPSEFAKSVIGSQPIDFLAQYADQRNLLPTLIDAYRQQLETYNPDTDRSEDQRRTQSKMTNLLTQRTAMTMLNDAITIGKTDQNLNLTTTPQFPVLKDYENSNDMTFDATPQLAPYAEANLDQSERRLVEPTCIGQMACCLDGTLAQASPKEADQLSQSFKQLSLIVQSEHFQTIATNYLSYLCEHDVPGYNSTMSVLAILTAKDRTYNREQRVLDLFRLFSGNRLNQPRDPHLNILNIDAFTKTINAFATSGDLSTVKVENFLPTPHQSHIVIHEMYVKPIEVALVDKKLVELE